MSSEVISIDSEGKR